MFLFDISTHFALPLCSDFDSCFFMINSAGGAEKVLEQYHLSADVSDSLLVNIRRRLTPQSIKIRADLEVMCFSSEGIDAIKAALRAGEAQSEADIVVKIKLVAPPLYVMMTSALSKERGIAVLQSACDAISKEVRLHGGEVHIKQAPRAVSERDDRLLGLLMETLEKQNQEVAGDDDQED